MVQVVLVLARSRLVQMSLEIRISIHVYFGISIHVYFGISCTLLLLTGVVPIDECMSCAGNFQPYRGTEQFA